MKKYINKSIILLLAMMISAVLLGIGVSAAGEVYTESDGIRTTYLSGSETVTLSDGTTRNAYNTLSSALTALDVDGGRVYVCGEVTDSTKINEDARTSPVLVTGLTGNTTDILTMDNTIRMGGSFTFDNFTLKTTISSGTYFYGGSGDKYFGPDFKTDGKFYYCNYSKNIDASNVVPRRTFFNTKASFILVSASSDSINFGTSALTEPVLSEIVVDDITLNTDNLAIDDTRNAMTTYGNINIIVNGGTFKDNSSLSYGNDTITGVATAILNNGTAEKFTTYTDKLDYVVKSAVGGAVSINTQAPFGGAPEFLFTPEDDKVPTVNGMAVTLSDGKYLYTPEVSDTQTILEVEWTEATVVAPEVYVIDGKPTVFISDTATVTSNGTTYGAYPGLAEAFAALGADGGVIYVCGTVHDSTRTDLGRVPIDGTTAREHVLIRGLESDAALHFYTTLNINAGPVTFENFTLNPTVTNGTPDDTSDDTVTATWYMTGSENTVFGEGFKIKWVNQNGGSPRVYYRTFMSQNFAANTNPTVHRTVFASSAASFVAASVGGYRDKFGSASSETPALVETVYDGVYILYNEVNAGFSDAADYMNRIYGNVNVYINGGNFHNKQVSLLNINETNYHTGRTTVIFNNGMNDANNWTIAAGVDYVVNSTSGGTAEIKTQAPFGGVPVFKLTPDEEGKVPCINGTTAISANDDGEFLYTPEAPSTSTDMVTTDNPEGTVTETISVTWIDKPEEVVEPQVYTINGKPSVFISDTSVIEDNGMKYGAYPGLVEAFAALGTDGGVIYVYGTVHDSTRTDLNKVPIDGTAARDHVLIRGWTSDATLHFYTTLNINAGPTTFENFTLYPSVTNGTADDTSDDTPGTWYMTGSENTVFGEGFKIPYVNVYSGNPRIYYRSMRKDGNTSHRTVFASNDAAFIYTYVGGYRTVFGSATSQDPALVELVYDGVFMPNAINAGFSETCDYQNRIYGNVNIYVNGGTFKTKAVNLLNVGATNYHTGRTTIIFNNGLNSDNGWTIASGVDYVINSAVGGQVEIYEQAPFGGAPTLKLTPKNEGYTAIINGEEILELDEVEGCIFYTPDIPSESDDAISDTNPEGTVAEVLNIEWIEIPDTCIVSFDANGGSGSVPESIECVHGEVYSLNDVEDTGLTMKDSIFLGWNTKKYASEALTSFTVPEAEAVTLYAVWQHNGVTLSEDRDGIGGIRVSTVDESEFEANDSVTSALAALENEPLNIAGFEAVYAFETKVYDSDDEAISSFDELCFEIDLSVLPELSAGECYVIYRENEFIPCTKNTDSLTLGDTGSGTYTVAVMNAKTATYTYKTVSYNKTTGEYVLALYFGGMDASYGTFGLAFDAEKLEFVSFTASENVILTGEDVGFGTYLCEEGTYRNTWEAANGSYINAADTPVEIGRFVFTAKSAITETSGLFAKAVFADAETVLPEGVAQTVYDTDENVYLYAPMIPSAYVYCQPTTEVFELETVETESEFTLKIATEREFGKTSANNAVITILSGDNVVLSLSESEFTESSSESGKTVLEITSELMPGEYTLKIQKNGYITYTTEITVGTDTTVIPDITLVCGDIKGNVQDVCGDGVIDIDDFIRVLRGFAYDATPEVRTAVDLNEDGSVNVTDLAIVKKNFGKSSVGQ